MTVSIGVSAAQCGCGPVTSPPPVACDMTRRPPILAVGYPRGHLSPNILWARVGHQRDRRKSCVRPSHAVPSRPIISYSIAGTHPTVLGDQLPFLSSSVLGCLSFCPPRLPSVLCPMIVFCPQSLISACPLSSVPSPQCCVSSLRVLPCE